MADTAIDAGGGGGGGPFMPSGWQCFLLAYHGTAYHGTVGGVHSAADASWLSGLTGIPADKLQEAAYACGHTRPSVPEQAVSGAGSAVTGAASAVGGTFSGVGKALEEFGKGVTTGPPVLLIAGGIIILALVLRR